jgi:hypothetical protein
MTARINQRHFRARPIQLSKSLLIFGGIIPAGDIFSGDVFFRVFSIVVSSKLKY